MEDEVDRLLEAWRRERPDLDVAPMEVLSPAHHTGPSPKRMPVATVSGLVMESYRREGIVNRGQR